jgi:alpha-1,2-mannosyltransferase
MQSLDGHASQIRSPYLICPARSLAQIRIDTKECTRRNHCVSKLRILAAFYWLAATGFVLALFVFVLPHFLGLDARVYYTAAQAVFQGNIDILYDPLRLTEFANRLASQSFSPAFTFVTWLYPPIFLILVVPLGLLPPVWFYVSFEMLTAAATAAATAWRRGVGGLLQTAAIVLSPAGCLNIIQGQNAFLSLGLFTGGVRLLDKRPVLAGALLGALVYKPQHAVLVPFALIGARAWRASAAATLMIVLLATISAILFGTEAWDLWLKLALHPPAYFYDWWFAYGMHNGFSPFVCAIVLGASQTTATVIQGFVSLAAGIAVLYLFYRTADWETRLAGLLCGTAIANPHLQGYELVLAASSITFIFRQRLRGGFIPGELLLLAVLWAPPVFPPIDFKIGFAIPVELIAFEALIVIRAARSDLAVVRSGNGYLAADI